MTLCFEITKMIRPHLRWAIPGVTAWVDHRRESTFTLARGAITAGQIGLVECRCA